jgi:hypothetical protein
VDQGVVVDAMSNDDVKRDEQRVMNYLGV